jgi:hypothetical protein
MKAPPMSALLILPAALMTAPAAAGQTAPELADLRQRLVESEARSTGCAPTQPERKTAGVWSVKHRSLSGSEPVGNVPCATVATRMAMPLP